jgi:hypothetical protein
MNAQRNNVYLVIVMVRANVTIRKMAHPALMSIFATVLRLVKQGGVWPELTSAPMTAIHAPMTVTRELMHVTISVMPLAFQIPAVMTMHAVMHPYVYLK